MKTKEITIKSEMDSRVLLYPLMRFLAPLGSCLIITSNTFVSRVLDGDYDGDYRNFRIIIDSEGATDELLEVCGINIQDYSIVIYDNVSTVEQDYLLVPIGQYVSDNFDEEILQLGMDDTTHIIKFGKPAKQKKEKVQKEDKKAKKDEDDLEKELRLEEEARNKFKGAEVDVRAKIGKLPNMQFPTYEVFEALEGAQILPDMDRNMFKLFFGIFGEMIAVKEPLYLKEVTRQDANSGSIERRSTNG